MAFLHDPHFQAVDGNGDPLSGAKLYFFNVGTEDAITTYQDAALTTPHASPVVADSAGRFAPVYLNTSPYKTRLDTSADTVVQTVQNVYGGFDGVASAGADVASATTTDLDAATGAIIDVIGTNTISTVTLSSGRTRWVRATAAWSLTASSTLVVDGQTTGTHTARAGDFYQFVGYDSSVVRVWKVGPVFDYKYRQNIIHNGDGQFNERVASSGVADDNYGHDRHYALTQSNSITVSTVIAPTDGVSAMMRLTQDNASAQRMGYAQIAEGYDAYKLRGQTATLGGKLRCSSSQAIRFAILEWTGTSDTVTSDVVNDWTSGTYTAGNFFVSSNITVNSVGSITPAANTVTDWSLTTTIGSSANNLILFYWTEATAAQNVTLDMEWYLIEGYPVPVGRNFHSRSPQQELALCHRFFESGTSRFYGYAVNTFQYGVTVDFKSRKRSTPTAAVTISAVSGFAAGDPVIESTTAYNFVAYKGANATGNGSYTFTWTATADL